MGERLYKQDDWVVLDKTGEEYRIPEIGEVWNVEGIHGPALVCSNKYVNFKGMPEPALIAVSLTKGAGYPPAGLRVEDDKLKRPVKFIKFLAESPVSYFKDVFLNKAKWQEAQYLY